MPGFGQRAAAARRGSSRPRPTWRGRCTSECLRARARAAARRRQLARRLGGAGNGARRLGRLGHRALPRRALARAARRAPDAGRAWARRLPPAGRAGAPGGGRCAGGRSSTFAAHPERVPAARRPRAGPRLDRRRGLRRRQPAMRTHVFDPAGYPAGRAGDDRLGRARPPGRPAAARAPPRRRPLRRHARGRPHADLGRPRARRPGAARGLRAGSVQGRPSPTALRGGARDRRADREPEVAVERLPGRRPRARHRRPDRRQRRAAGRCSSGPTATGSRSPTSSSPTPTPTTSPASPRRARRSATRRWSPTRRPPPSSTTRSR